MKLKGYIFAALAAAAYGTNPYFAINLYAGGMNPNSVCLFRYALCIPLLALILILRGRAFRIPRHTIAPVMILGVLMGASSLMLFESYNYINSGIASTLLFVYPVLVALMMVFFFHERFQVTTGICLAIMLGGLFLLMRNAGGEILDPFGVLLVAFSSLTYAIYLVMINVSKHVREIPTTVLLFYVLLSGTLVFLAMIPLGATLVVPVDIADWGRLLALALIPTIISLYFTTLAIQAIGPTPTAIFGALEPVTAVALSVFALGQTITGREVTGAVLVCVATTLIVVSDSLEHYILRVRKMFPSLKKRK